MNHGGFYPAGRFPCRSPLIHTTNICALFSLHTGGNGGWEQLGDFLTQGQRANKCPKPMLGSCLFQNGCRDSEKMAWRKGSRPGTIRETDKQKYTFVSYSSIYAPSNYISASPSFSLISRLTLPSYPHCASMPFYWVSLGLIGQSKKSYMKFQMNTK